jgi:hypothetical protein
MMEAAMKTQVSSLTQPTNNKRSRTMLALVGGLIVLAVAIVGAALVLSQRAPQITSGAAAHRPLIADCRMCADEALAARQSFIPNAGRATQTAAADTNTRPLIVTCRVCVDEALAAHQPSIPASARAAQRAPTGVSARSLITNCRACRDEALSGIQASFGMVDSGTVFPQLDDPHRPGSR